MFSPKHPPHTSLLFTYLYKIKIGDTLLVKLTMENFFTEKKNLHFKYINIKQ